MNSQIYMIPRFLCGAKAFFHVNISNEKSLVFCGTQLISCFSFSEDLEVLR